MSFKVLIVLVCILKTALSGFQKAVSLISQDRYIDCTTELSGLSFNYEQLGGIQYIQKAAQFSISGVLRLRTFDDANDINKDISILAMTYDSGNDFPPYTTISQKVLSFRLNQKQFTIDAIDDTNFDASTNPNLTHVLSQDIQSVSGNLNGLDIFFYLSVDFSSGNLYFCHQIVNEQSKCSSLNVNNLNVLNPNFNKNLSTNVVLNFGYERNFDLYCQGVTDLKFYSGFYSSQSEVIDSLLGGERVKKSYWKFDQLSTSGGIADQWRTRNSQSTVDPTFLSNQMLLLEQNKSFKLMDSQMNEQKSHTISFWMKISNPNPSASGSPLDTMILFQRIKQNVPIFKLEVQEITNGGQCQLIVTLYNQATAVSTPFVSLISLDTDLFISLSIYQVLLMQNVQVRMFLYDPSTDITITEILIFTSVSYPRGGLESDPASNSFQIGGTLVSPFSILINELSVQSGYSIFAALTPTASAFYIQDNCQISIGILNPYCMVCKVNSYLNHLDGKCYLQSCPPNYSFQAENSVQRVCELCDSSCNSSFCSASSSCSVCAEGYSPQPDGTCATVCGDGLVRGNEECDIGAQPTTGPSGCIDCKVVSTYECVNYVDKVSECSSCGDAVYKIGLINEQCDYAIPLQSAGCTTDCKIIPGYECTTTECFSICGDGIVGAGESCDDGNTIQGDGCGKTCLVESNYVCYYNTATDTKQLCKQNVSCGDGIKGATEACDDGNLINGDGCDLNCIIESPNFQCDSVLVKGKSICTPVCGDGIHVPNLESCDVGASNDPGCNNCLVVPGYQCSGGSLTSPDTCSTICGDNLALGSEVCDLGPSSSICLNNCSLVDPRWTCQIDSQNKSVCTPKCGDGTRFTEECDDGNLINGDGCDSNCKIELGYICKNGDATHPDVCGKKCGQTVNDIIECDDGNNLNGDGCTSNCKVEKGYVCKKQVTGSGIHLPDVCFSICGDGILTSNEQCDDGNSTNGDGCSYSCNIESGYVCNKTLTQDNFYISDCSGICGDGVKLPSEECDDGNLTDEDGCSFDCQIETNYGCLSTGSTSTSICMSCPTGTCSQCNIFLDSNQSFNNICSKCNDGFYLDSSKNCQSCQENCVICSSSTSCSQCDGSYVIGPTSACVECSPYYGYQLNETTYECEEICGDGKRVGFEECDDGNLYGGDGCGSSCGVESGFKCSGGSYQAKDICWKAEGAHAVMTQDRENPNILKIQFEDEVIISQSFQWRLTLPFISESDYKYECVVVDQVIQVIVTFADENAQIKGEYAYFYFNDLSSVKTSVGQQNLTVNKINALLIYGLSPSWDKVRDSSVEMLIIQVFIYIATFTFILSFIASVIVTSSIPFWSTIEFLQTVNLLQYQNADLPDKLSYFLSLFNFANLRLFGDMNIKKGDQYYESTASPEQFQKTGLNNLFLYNFIPILVIWVIVLSLYAMSVAYFRLKSRSILDHTTESKSFIYKFMKNYNETFKYNIMARTLIFIFTPLSIITLLQVRGSNFEFALTGISTLLSYASLMIIVLFPILAYRAIKQRYNQLDQQFFFKKYGSLVFGLNLKNQVTRIYNIQNTVKKFLLSLFLVAFHDNPIAQSALISILGCINLGLILYFSPKADTREQDRITFGEITIFFIHLCYILFAFDDQTFRVNGTFKFLVGWFVIALVMVGYLFEAGFLAKQLISHIKQKQQDKLMRDCSLNQSEQKNINRVYKTNTSQKIDVKQIMRSENL